MLGTTTWNDTNDLPATMHARVLRVGDRTYALSYTARRRIDGRHLSLRDVVTVLTLGRRWFDTGAWHHTIGRREVQRYRYTRPDLARLEGLQVICSPDDTILTAYRNREIVVKHDRRLPRGKTGNVHAA